MGPNNPPTAVGKLNSDCATNKLWAGLAPTHDILFCYPNTVLISSPTLNQCSNPYTDRCTSGNCNSVYLPSRFGATEDFRDLLDIIDGTFLQFPDCIILFLRDFNADPGSSLSPPNEQGRILQRYLDHWTFMSTHLSLQSQGSLHTYESDAHQSNSVIDHILCPEFFLSNIHVLLNHPINWSDHLPLLAISLSSPPDALVWLGVRPILIV